MVRAADNREELRVNLYHMWVRQSDTKKGFLQHNQGRQRAMVTMMEEAYPHIHTHTHLVECLLSKHSMSGIGYFKVWEGEQMNAHLT